MAIDHDWYLRFLVWGPTTAFLGGLIFTLWTGRLFARGPVFTRHEHSKSYWTGVMFLVLGLIITTYLAATSFS